MVSRLLYRQYKGYAWRRLYKLYKEIFGKRLYYSTEGSLAEGYISGIKGRYEGSYIHSTMGSFVEDYISSIKRKF